jgi:hypothetical protein
VFWEIVPLSMRKRFAAAPFSSGFPDRGQEKRRSAMLRERREISCPAFPGHKRHLLPRNRHTGCTQSAVEIKIYWGFKKVLLIKKSQCHEFHISTLKALIAIGSALSTFLSSYRTGDDP